MQARDESVTDSATYYYTIFAFDGSEWLRWTEGWNSDDGFAADMPTPGVELVAGGCGCSQTNLAPWAIWAGALLLLTRLRRRR